LRHHFRKVVGISPSAWRNAFRGKAAAGHPQSKTGATRAPVEISLV
jgi:hypothetical protein